MIVTVTLNPALDLTYSVEALVPHGVHRVAAAVERAGGKGVNVARVLHAIGEPVLATGLLGGATGGRIADLLAADGVPATFTAIAGDTRRTVAVADQRDATGFWEPGPQISAAEWSLMLTRYRELLKTASVVALCGSLPPGVPLDGYAEMVRLAAAAGVPTVLDTSGEPLRLGLAAGPTLAKPNAAELITLLDRPAAHPVNPGPAAPATAPSAAPAAYPPTAATAATAATTAPATSPTGAGHPAAAANPTTAPAAHTAAVGAEVARVAPEGTARDLHAQAIAEQDAVEAGIEFQGQALDGVGNPATTAPTAHPAGVGAEVAGAAREGTARDLHAQAVTGEKAVEAGVAFQSQVLDGTGNPATMASAADPPTSASTASAASAATAATTAPTGNPAAGKPAAAASVPTAADVAAVRSASASTTASRTTGDDVATAVGSATRLAAVPAAAASPDGWSISDLAEAVRAIAPGAGAVVVSRGPLGLVAVTRDGVWVGRPPVPMKGNPTGAGDAVVAALARGLRDRTPWPALLADAVALSAAAVAAPIAGAFDAGVYRRILPLVTITEHPGGPRADTHR